MIKHIFIFHFSFLVTLVLLLFSPLVKGADRIDLQKNGQDIQKLIQNSLASNTSEISLPTKTAKKSLNRAQQIERQRRDLVVDQYNDLKVIKYQKGKATGEHIRYQQHYKSIPIWGRHVRATIREGNIHRLKGGFYTGLNTELKEIDPEFSPLEAISQAKSIFEAQQDSSGWFYQDETANLYIYLKNNQIPILAYVVRFFAKQESEPVQYAEPVLIIDAKSSELIKTWNGLRN